MEDVERFALTLAQVLTLCLRNGTNATTGLEYDSVVWGVRAAGRRRTAGKSENRSLPCVNSCNFSFCCSALSTDADTHDNRHHMRA